MVSCVGPVVAAVLVCGTRAARLDWEEVGTTVVPPLAARPALAALHWQVPPLTARLTLTLAINRSSPGTVCPAAARLLLWIRPTTFPLVQGKGRVPAQMLPLQLAGQLERELEVGAGGDTVRVEGPEPGIWLALLATSQPECSVEVKSRVGGELEPGPVVPLTPQYHNYQDLRTLYTVTGRQLFRFRVPADAWVANISLPVCRAASGQAGCPVKLLVRPSALPGPASPNTATTSCRAGPACFLTLDTVAGVEHFLAVLTESPVQVAVSVQLGGCRDPGYTEGAMLVNSIDTERLCGEPGKRPLKILFRPSGGQPRLENCGPLTPLTRRTSHNGLDYDFVLPGESLAGGERAGLRLAGPATATLDFSLDQRDAGGSLAVELAVESAGHHGQILEVGIYCRSFKGRMNMKYCPTCRWSAASVGVIAQPPHSTRPARSSAVRPVPACSAPAAGEFCLQGRSESAAQAGSD